MNYLKTILCTGFLLLSFISSAQISFDDDVDDEAPAAPIDGFLTAGLMAGAAYGLHKLRERRK